MRRAGSAATVVGLAIALGGPALLVSPLGAILGDPDRLATRFLGQAVLWLLLAAIVVVVLGFERRPLASLGLRPFQWTSLAWGAGLAVTLMFVVVPISLAAVSAFGLAGFEAGVAEIVALPLAFRVLAVVTAGVVEETLFRGYALTRVAELTGSHAWAGVLTLTIFALVHLPLWGPGPVLSFFFTGGAFTVFFIWRKDLVANVVAHGIIDATGLILAPLQ